MTTLPSFRTVGAPLLGAFLLGVSTLAGAGRCAAGEPDDPLVQAAFERGTLTEGQRSLEAALAGSAGEDATATRRRYALGIVELLRSAETLGQAWRHYGLQTDASRVGFPFLRLPVGQANPATVAPISYEDFRAVFVRFLADVKVAEGTLAALPADPGTVPLRPGLVRFDYVGDGRPDGTETLWRTYGRLHHGAATTEVDAGNFLIRFDAGDVPWFRGYCHLLSALAETLLAYDESSLFDHTAHLFFLRPETPFPFLAARSGGSGSSLPEFAAISDVVAFVHLINFPVREPARLTAALDHLSQVTALSRESWRRIQAETDDDHEWIPNPRQTGVLPGVRVTQEQIDAWLKTLDEADAILAGRKLLPFWRGGDREKRGVNLHRVLTEPSAFDLVLWLQGTAAVPYLQEGTPTDLNLWKDVNSAFGGNALGFALYFN